MIDFSLPTVIAIASAVSLLVCGFFMVLSRSRSSHIGESCRWFALAYGANGVRLICQLVVMNGTTALAIPADVFYLGWVFGIWGGIARTVHQKPPRLLITAVPLALACWDIAARLYGLSLTWLTLPQNITGALLFWSGGLHIWRFNRKRGNWGLAALAIAMWFQGVNTASYPFTRLTWYAPYGFISLALLATAMGMGLMVTGLIEEQADLRKAIEARKRAEAKIHDLNANLERQVTERTEELVAANQEMEAFAYAVSHDLRAPLRALSGFCRILMEDYSDKLDADGRASIEHISQASINMGKLIDGLLTLSRVTRNELKREVVDLSVLAHRVRAELQDTEPTRRVDWDIEAALTVRGDSRLLESAMRNLLDNAWKYTGASETGRIRVFSQKEAGERRICVADNGAGFDMSFAEQLFQPFRRLHRQEEFPGLGIGLATVLRVIRRHGGQIHAKAEPGNGALFWFTLPERGQPGLREGERP